MLDKKNITTFRNGDRWKVSVQLGKYFLLWRHRTSIHVAVLTVFSLLFLPACVHGWNRNVPDPGVADIRKEVRGDIPSFEPRVVRPIQRENLGVEGGGLESPRIPPALRFKTSYYQGVCLEGFPWHSLGAAKKKGGIYRVLSDVRPPNAHPSQPKRNRLIWLSVGRGTPPSWQSFSRSFRHQSQVPEASTPPRTHPEECDF